MTDPFRKPRTPALQCGTCGDEAVGVCNCMLAQPISEAYCRRCLVEGLEALPIIKGTLYCCLPGPVTRAEASEGLAAWALEIIDRSLDFHDESWDEVMASIDWTDAPSA